MEHTRNPYKTILAVCLLLLAAIYLGYHIINSLRTDTELFTVRPYTAKDSAVFTGYLFREEILLTSHTSGMYRYFYYDGEKVGADKTVAEVYRNGNSDTAEALKQYKKQIEILRRSESLGRLTAEEIQTKIDRLTFLIAEKNAAGETASAGALSDELLVFMAKKDLLASEKTNYQLEIFELEQEMNRLIATLGYANETVTTPKSGYFYAEADGFETIFTSETAKHLTLAEFHDLITAAPASTQNAVGTLITSSQWYYAAKTDSDTAQGFTTGMTYDCLFIDNGYAEQIPMKLITKETEKGETLLVFYSSALPRDFDITRIQRMEAVKGEYTGLRIPAEVVRVKDGVTYVYVLKEGIAREREIEILWEQNGYFIISEQFEGISDLPNLKLNDLILIGETDLYDGKFIP